MERYNRNSTSSAARYYSSINFSATPTSTTPIHGLMLKPYGKSKRVRHETEALPPPQKIRHRQRKSWTIRLLDWGRPFISRTGSSFTIYNSNGTTMSETSYSIISIKSVDDEGLFITCRNEPSNSCPMSSRSKSRNKS